MPVPDFQMLMRPALEALADGAEQRTSAVAAAVAKALRLSPQDIGERLSTGEYVLANRVRWATIYLANAGAIEMPRRGFRRITKRGLELLKKADRIDTKTLLQFPEYRAWREGPTKQGASGAQAGKAEAIEDASVSPQEAMDRAFARSNAVVQADLLRRLLQCEPQFFEDVVLRLLDAMGYSGARGTTQALGGTGDGGVDGVIHQDALGLESVYVQAKRYAGSVGSPEMNNFIGALDRKKASKGVLMTTGDITPKAREAARESSKKVALIDGARLSSLMLQHGVGVSTLARYEIKRVDSDFFESD